MDSGRYGAGGIGGAATLAGSIATIPGYRVKSAAFKVWRWVIPCACIRATSLAS